MDFGIYSLYNNLIDTKVKFCSLCLITVKENAACCVQDSIILDLDEEAESSNCEEVDMQYILQEILGNKIASYLSENDAICNKCTQLAIIIYKFIKMCKTNMERMVAAVDLFTTTIGEPDKNFEDEKTLFLSMNFQDSECIQYLDTSKFENKKSALSRVQFLFGPYELLTDDEGNTKYKCIKCAASYSKASSARRHFASKHIDDPDIRKEAQNVNTVLVGDSPTELGRSQPKHNNEKSYTVIKDSKGKNKYNCIKCPKICTNAASARRHYQVAHAPIGKSKKLKSREISNDYVRCLNEISDEEMTDLDNTQCDTVFSNAHQHFEKPHMEDVSIGKEAKEKTISQKPATCIFCSKNFENEYVLTKHILEEHSIEPIKDFTDIESDKIVFNYIYTVLKDDNDCSIFQCKVCEKLFKNQSIVTLHFKKQHLKVDGTRQLICSHCGKNCKNRYVLKRHEELHALKLTCPTCKKVYKSRDCFKQHICLKNTLKRDMQDVICDYCGKHFKSKRLLRNHIRCHHDPQSQIVDGTHQFICSHCGKDCKDRYALKRHEELHALELTCPTCNKVYKSRDCFKQHVCFKETSKRDMQDVICDYCSKHFKSKHLLRNHIRCHHDPKSQNYKCQSDSKGFGNVMLEHKRKHNNVNSSLYISSDGGNDKKELQSKTCILCNENFENKYGLTIHILKEHSIKNVKDFTGIEADKKVFNYVYTVVKDENDCKKYQCRVCGKLFKKISIVTHFKKIHLKAHETDHEYICSHCCKKYKDQSSLNRHEKSHTTKITCPTCNKVYKSEAYFKKHICFRGTTRSDMQRDLICDYCQKKYASKNSLSIHIRYHHNPQSQRYNCQHCPKTFGALSIWKAHQIKHTRERRFNCASCGKAYATKTALIHHTRTHTGERPFACKYCDMRFVSSSRRASHMIRKHIAAMDTCNICGDQVATSHMYRHKRKHDDPNSNLYISSDGGGNDKKVLCSKTCILCNENFENKYGLTVHILKEHSIESVKDFTGIKADKKVFNYVYTVVKDENDCEKYQCKVCGKLFKKCTIVTTHFKLLHLKVHETDHEFVCSHCGKKCKDKSSLNRHEESHTVKVTCPTCDKVYKSKAYLKRHVCFKGIGRNLQRDVICDYCEKKFTSKHSLKIHIKYHHNPQSQRYNCQHCPKTFGALSLWKAHQLKHTGEKNFTCDICCNVFASKMSLTQHRRIHTGELPFDCQYCDMKFLSSSRRAIHVNRHHHIAAKAVCDICGIMVKAHQMYRHKRIHNNPNSRLCISKGGGSAKKGNGRRRLQKNKSAVNV